MRLRSQFQSWVTLVAVAALIVTTGCQESVPPVADEASNSESETPLIVDGEMPTSEQKQAMLAAKDALFEKLSGRLMEAMASPGPAAAIAVCQQEATQIAADVSNDHGLKIGRTGVRLRNLNNQPPS